jgi:hypothetical protein
VISLRLFFDHSNLIDAGRTRTFPSWHGYRRTRPQAFGTEGIARRRSLP